jgi:hypothetical protein
VPPELGTDATDQDVPFHTSINVSIAEPVFVSPTATHHDVDTHDTERNLSSRTPALGLGIIDQKLPSHTIAKVSTAETVTSYPTATHHDVDTHDTEFSTYSLAPGLGLGMTTAVSTTAPAGDDTTTQPNTIARVANTARIDLRTIREPRRSLSRDPFAGRQSESSGKATFHAASNARTSLPHDFWADALRLAPRSAPSPPSWGWCVIEDLQVNVFTEIGSETCFGKK